MKIQWQVITVAAILMTVSSLFMSWQAMERERASVQHEKGLVFWSSELMRASNVLTDEVRRYAAIGDKNHYDAYWREINEVKTRDRALEQLRLLGVSATDMLLPEQAKQQSDGLISLEEKSMAAVARGDLEEARQLVFGSQYDAFKEKISAPLEEFSIRVKEMAKAELDLAQSRSVTLMIVSIALFMATGVWFIYLSYGIVGNRIVKRLNILWSAVNRLADGDLKSVIPDLGGNDEITDLSNALSALRESALNRERLEREKQEETEVLARNREIVNQLVKDFDHAVAEGLGAFTSAAFQLKETSHTMSDNANRASDEIAQSVQTFQKTSENTQNISHRTDELTRAIREISEQVSMAANVSLDAEEQAHKTRQTVATLSESAGKIGEVAELINAIASQTNLLALNATIESARAGEAGKGFAVVASEVKSLAGQTGKATEEITSQIMAVQTATNNTAKEIGKIGEMIQSIREVTGIISAAITEQSSATEEISHHIQEVAGSSEDINRNFRQIGDAADENMKTSDNLIGASNDLRNHSEMLRKEVETFLGSIKKTMHIA